MERKIGINIGYQMVYRILTIITPLITTPIISRAFGAQGVGEYSATIAYVTYFTLFAMLGIENYGNRAVAAVQDDAQQRSRLFCEIYSIQCVSSLSAILVYFASFCFIDSSRFVLAAIQGIWLFSYLVDINWFFFGMEQFKLTVVRSSVIKIITVCLIVLFIKNSSDLYLYAGIMGGGALVGQLVLWRYIKKYVIFQKPSLLDIKKHIRPILKLYVPIIAISIFRLMDKSMLDVFSTSSDVGYYYSADKIVSIPFGVVTAISTVMLPRLSNVFHNQSDTEAKKLISQSTELSIFLVSAVSFGIASVAKEFVPIFFGDGYDVCIELIYFFVPVLIVKVLEDIICSQYLIPTHKDNIYMAALICGAIANILSNIPLIRCYGALGAVLGTLVAECVVLVVQLFFIKDVPFLRFFISEMQYIVFGGIMSVVVRSIGNHIDFQAAPHIIILVLVGGICYLLCCVVWWMTHSNSVFHSATLKTLSVFLHR